MEQFLVIVECAIEIDGKLLLIKRPENSYAGGLLAFPGGKIEYEDSSKYQNILISALKREVKEEVGLNLIDPLHYVTSSHFIGYQGVNVINNVFYCKIERSSPEIQTSKREVANYYLLTIQEANLKHNCPD